MGTLWDQLQNIPTTHETVSKAKIDELLLQNMQQLNDEERRHISTVSKHDDDFANIAFSDPATWQLSAFEREHTHSNEAFHIMTTGYDNYDMSKYHNYEHIHAQYAYRVIFLVNVMHTLSPEIYWFAPFDLRPAMRNQINDLHRLKSWDLEIAAYEFMLSAHWSKPERKDWELIKQDTVQTNRQLHEFRTFLIDLLPYAEESFEYDVKLSDMLLIGHGD